MSPRSLSAIAREIQTDWHKVHFAAVPYLRAMAALDNVGGYYDADDARGIVAYFLSNAGGWRGANAKRIKAELKDMIG